jgi:hypothetical protein
MAMNRGVAAGFRADSGQLHRRLAKSRAAPQECGADGAVTPRIPQKRKKRCARSCDSELDFRAGARDLQRMNCRGLDAP